MNDQIVELAVAYVMRSNKLPEAAREGVVCGLAFALQELLSVLAQTEESLRREEAKARDVVYLALVAADSLIH